LLHEIQRTEEKNPDLNLLSMQHIWRVKYK